MKCLTCFPEEPAMRSRVYLTLLVALAVTAQPTAGGDTSAQDKARAAAPGPYHEKADAKADVQAALKAGLAQAAKTDRLVFLHFGAPWCGWCHRLEAWMARPEIAAVLDKEFVDVMIDIDRMEGGKEILKRYNTTGRGGIPWFAFVDRQGKALATSDGPKGNIGHPYAEEEVAYFVKMLQTTRRHLSPQDIGQIEQSLKAQKQLGK